MVFKAILIVGLFSHATSTVISVKIPMVDLATCEAVAKQLRVSAEPVNDKSLRVDWLGSVCELKI